MSLQKRIEVIERKTNAAQAANVPTLTDEERAEGWRRLIEVGNPRAIELYEIAKKRRDAARGVA